MLIALHKGKGFIGRCIQWQTRSVYSHASVVFGSDPWSDEVIESREFKGVRLLPYGLNRQEEIDLFQLPVPDPGEREQIREQVRDFMMEQLWKPYDYTMVARFISRRQASRKQSGKWFCSELVFAAFLAAGVPLLDRIEPWAVSPGLLALSPLLKQLK